MIESKKDYLDYLEADKRALGIKRSSPKIFGDEIWKYQRLLRRVEYYHNCRKYFWEEIHYWYLRFCLHNYGIKLGYTISPNIFGPGLSIAHIGTIVVNSDTKVGKNCRIHISVNIGYGGVTIGDNVYIGPGAKLYGPIKIADNIAIGANSVVNESFKESGITIAGIPAKKISDKGSFNMGCNRRE